MAGIITLVSCINFLFVLIGYFMARTLQYNNTENKEPIIKRTKSKFSDEEVFIPED